MKEKISYEEFSCHLWDFLSGMNFDDKFDLIGKFTIEFLILAQHENKVMADYFCEHLKNAIAIFKSEYDLT